MTEIVNNMNSFFASGNIWENLGFLLPVVGGVLIFAFTFAMLKEIISMCMKGKAGL